jgi:UDP-N-acetylglucosamine acyltransferase
MKIHPTAIVHPDAELADDVDVHPYAVIGPNVRIGAGTVIGPHCVVDGNTTIGERNRFFPGGQIGAPSQDLKNSPELRGRLVIGSDNVIREFVTLTVNTMRNASETNRCTSIGNGNLLMCYVHIGHDCKIFNNAVIASYSGLSGHVEVHDYANVGGQCALHQYTRIGSYSFVGGMSGASKDCLPYMLSSGTPTKCHGPNTIGLQRAGFDKAARLRIKEMYRILCRSKLNTTQAIQEILRSVDESPERKYLVEFIETSERGVSK